MARQITGTLANDSHRQLYGDRATNANLFGGSQQGVGSIHEPFPGNQVLPAPVPGMPGFAQIEEYYRDLQPVFQTRAEDAVSGALAGAGFSGNRYGSAAMNQAARVAGDIENQLSAQTSGMIQQQINDDMNRALQKYMADKQAEAQIQASATSGSAAAQLARQTAMDQLAQRAHEYGLNYGLQAADLGLDYYNADQAAHQWSMQFPYQAAMWENDIFAGQVNPLMQFGQWETGRQDNFWNAQLQDWARRMSPNYLPNMIGAAAGIGPGFATSPITVTSDPGSPGNAGWVEMLGDWFLG